MKRIRKIEKFIKKVIILGFLGIVCICLDIFLKNKETSLNEIARILFDLITVVAGIWVTCYLLFIQIYRDSYPLKIISETYLPKLKEYLVYSIFAIIYGLIIIFRQEGLFENLFFSAISVIIIVKILWHTYKSNKSLMINTYIDKFCEEIQNGLNGAIVEIDDYVLENIQRLLDESLVKEEYYIVQNITKRLGEIFIDFIKNSLEMIDKNTEKDLEKNYRKILNIFIFELEHCSSIKSDIVIREIVEQNVKNIKYCIKGKQFEWFKEYVYKLNVLYFTMQRNGKEDEIKVLNIINKKIIKELILAEKPEWIQFMVNDIFEYTKSLNFIFENRNLKHFCELLTTTMSYSLREKKYLIYSSLFETLKELTELLCRVPKGFNNVLVYYTIIFNDLKKYNNEEVINFIELLFDETESLTDDSKLVEFKFYCISEMSGKGSNDQNKKIREYHIRTLLNTIEMNGEYKGYIYSPEFSKKIQDKISQEDVDVLCEEMKVLLNKCIICDNIITFFYYLEEIGTCLNKTQIQNRLIQEKIFNIYIFLIIRTSRLKNRKFLEVLFSQLIDELRTMDSLKIVSKDFATFIIDKLAGCAQHSENDNHFMILGIIDLLRDFMEEENELSFVSNQQNIKKFLYRNLFNIGTSCIENNFEEGLRRVSNALGWAIIYNLKQGNGDLIKYLIGRASELYVLSKRMDISSKTQTFMLTLFTTVGTYCCKENKNRVYLGQIIDCIADEDMNKINTAIRLRTSENDMWNELYDNKTKDLTNDFLKQFRIKNKISQK